MMNCEDVCIRRTDDRSLTCVNGQCSSMTGFLFCLPTTQTSLLKLEKSTWDSDDFVQWSSVCFCANWCWVISWLFRCEHVFRPGKDSYLTWKFAQLHVFARLVILRRRLFCKMNRMFKPFKLQSLSAVISMGSFTISVNCFELADNALIPIICSWETMSTAAIIP